MGKLMDRVNSFETGMAKQQCLDTTVIPTNTFDPKTALILSYLIDSDSSLENTTTEIEKSEMVSAAVHFYNEELTEEMAENVTVDDIEQSIASAVASGTLQIDRKTNEETVIVDLNKLYAAFPDGYSEALTTVDAVSIGSARVKRGPLN